MESDIRHPLFKKNFLTRKEHPSSPSISEEDTKKIDITISMIVDPFNKDLPYYRELDLPIGGIITMFSLSSYKDTHNNAPHHSINMVDRASIIKWYMINLCKYQGDSYRKAICKIPHHLIHIFIHDLGKFVDTIASLASFTPFASKDDQIHVII